MSTIYTQRLTQEVTLHLRSLGAEDSHGVAAVIESDLEVMGYVGRQIATEQGVVVGESMRLFLTAEAPLTGWDSVTVVGETFEVVGAPWQVFNPRTGSVHHVEADIKRASSSG